MEYVRTCQVICLKDNIFIFPVSILGFKAGESNCIFFLLLRYGVSDLEDLYI